MNTEHGTELEELPLLETLDHLLDRGVIIAGEAGTTVSPRAAGIGYAA